MSSCYFNLTTSHCCALTLFSAFWLLTRSLLCSILSYLYIHIECFPYPAMVEHWLIFVNISYNSKFSRCSFLQLFFSWNCSKGNTNLVPFLFLKWLYGMNHLSYFQACRRKPRHVWTHLTKPKILWQADLLQSPAAATHLSLFPSSSHLSWIFMHVAS